MLSVCSGSLIPGHSQTLSASSIKLLHSFKPHLGLSGGAVAAIVIVLLLVVVVLAVAVVIVILWLRKRSGEFALHCNTDNIDYNGIP